MTDRVGFKVEGLNAVVRSLTKFGLTIEDLKDAFSKIAAEGANVARSYVPRASGKLAGDVRGNRAKSKASIIAGRASVKYAGPINYGWGALHSGWKGGAYAKGIKGAYAGSGFMQKADEIMQPKAVQMLESEINKTIRKQGLK